MQGTRGVRHLMGNIESLLARSANASIDAPVFFADACTCCWSVSCECSMPKVSAIGTLDISMQWRSRIQSKTHTNAATDEPQSMSAAHVSGYVPAVLLKICCMLLKAATPHCTPSHAVCAWCSCGKSFWNQLRCYQRTRSRLRKPLHPAKGEGRRAIPALTLHHQILTLHQILTAVQVTLIAAPVLVSMCLSLYLLPDTTA